MKTLFNEKDKAEILSRIQRLKPDSKAQWGKMDVAQAMAHVSAATEVPLGQFIAPMGFMSLIGQFMKGMILNEKPFAPNSPTARAFKVTDKRDFETERRRLVNAIEKFSMGEKSIVQNNHPLLRKLKANEWGQLNYKHADHHLRQFGV